VALSAGTRLGPYEILEPLGAGGMGEVYRARDSRLGREVAIKILPPEHLSDATRRARFVQEARAASALNHPHIVTIHEIESAEGLDFIVMELVPGKTLDALIPRQGMRLGEALRIVIPLADALAAAHATGIVHRDLKPANVMVTPEGVVKVLDFGLAKLTREDATTLDVRAKLSRSGTAAGTPAYMSPEQASGGTVDARSDVFSFGAVLYEMVTGRHPFRGDSVAEMFAALLKEEPKPPTELVAGVPKELERIILRCLRKERDRRFQSVLDVKIELQEVKEESDSRAEAPTGAATAGRRRHRWWVIASAAGVLILATVVAAALWRLRQPERPPPTVVQLTSARQSHSGSFSPDGDRIAFASAGEKGDNWDIWLKIVGAAEARRLTTDPVVDDCPSWSPDGRQIAFVRFPELTGARAVTAWDVGFLHLVSPLGGAERRISDLPVGVALSWSPDGRWLAAAKDSRGADPPDGIHLVPVGPGEPRALTSPQPPAFDHSPAFSPDGGALAYASCEGRWGICDVHVLPLDSELHPKGAPRRLTRQRLAIGGVGWTRDGRSIVYDATPGSYLWRVRADGSTSPERVELAGRGACWPFTAPARDRLGFTRQTWDPDVYRLRLGSSPTPLIESTFADDVASYSPDGRRLAFCSDRADDTFEVWLADADGGHQVRLTHGPGRDQCGGWSPDGGSITFTSVGEDGHSDIWAVDVDGSGLHQITRDPADESFNGYSRDGRVLYFTSNRTGRDEVWRVPAGGGPGEQVTHEGGCGPLESPDGRTLYYRRSCQGQTLLARPTVGGQERTVVPCVSPTMSYPVPAPGGILYLECPREGAVPGQHQLRLFDEATGEDRPFATLEGDFISGLSLSADGQTILYGRSSWGTSDLMMIENFR
jgi:serine/threonine protein kinase/Tol biopolymer transport system component